MRAAKAYDQLGSILERMLDGAEAEDWDSAHAAATEVEDFDLEELRTSLPLAVLLAGAAEGWAGLARYQATRTVESLRASRVAFERALEQGMDIEDYLHDIAAAGYVLALAAAHALDRRDPSAQQLLDAARMHLDIDRFAVELLPEEATPIAMAAALVVWRVELDHASDDDTRLRLRCLMANAHHFRYALSGQLREVDDAATHYLEALTGSTSAMRATPRDYMMAATVLALRYERRSDAADLEVAFDFAQRAVALGDPVEVAHAERLGELSVIHQMRYQRSEDPDDLEAALVLLGEARALITPDHEWWPLATANQSTLLHLVAERDDDPLKAATALSLARSAALETPIGILRVEYMCLYGERFVDAYDYDMAQDAELDYVIEMLEAFIINSAEIELDWVKVAQTLERCLLRRAVRDGSRADLKRIDELATRRSRLKSVEPREKAQSHVSAARAQAGIGNWRSAANNFESAIEDYHHAALQPLTRSDQDHLLAHMANLASDAAAAVLRGRRPDLQRALRLFARAKGITSGIAANRAELIDRLRTADAEVVAAYEEAAARHDVLREQLVSGWTSALPTGVTMESLRRASDELYAQRTALGLHDLDTLAGENPGDALAASSGDPVVCIACSHYGVYAIALSRSGLDVFELEVTQSEVEVAMREVRAAVDSHDSSGSTSTSDRRAQLEEPLGLLGAEVLSPPVRNLIEQGYDLHEEPIRWCLAGDLSELPIAAAHYVADPGETASVTGKPVRLVDVCDGYLVSNLAVRRRDIELSDLSPAVLVAMPHTPGSRSLPRAADEVRMVQEVLHPGDCTTLAAPSTTRASTVSRSLGTAGLAHFACHVKGDPLRPESVRIALSDDHVDRLSAARIAASSCDGSLVFLNACSSARPAGNLPDDAFDIASAFRLAGFHNVVATRWDVRDDDSYMLAEAFYSALRSDCERNSTCRPEHALRRAQLMLRAECDDDVRRWASHVVMRG